MVLNLILFSLSIPRIQLFQADKIFGSAPSPAMSEAGFVGGVNIPSEKLVRYTTAVGSAEKTKSGAAAYKMNDAANGGVSRKPNLMPHSL